MNTTLRGWILAAAATAACVGTWAAVVDADQRIGEAAGFNRERAWLRPLGDIAAATKTYRTTPAASFLR